jgi:hypothetical protein
MSTLLYGTNSEQPHYGITVMYSILPGISIQPDDSEIPNSYSYAAFFTTQF